MSSTQACPVGKCPACGKAYHLTKRGVLRMHRKRAIDLHPCNGSGLAPVVKP